MKDVGTRNIHCAEHVGRHRSIPGPQLDVYVDREATLSTDLSEIEHRKIRDISIVLREGFEDEQRIRLTPEAALSLSDMLSTALTAAHDLVVTA